ncbi:hypothetical protein [Variovorax sp. dw_308]|uniref:hypothetical protein n=1 Tax=Variovorax sp. dw_308 TaxID=2721546 RepID=UPI001C44C01A|nr:hypothetical protein [Variovorax sp. dw_308]
MSTKKPHRVPGWDRVIEHAQYHTHDVVNGKVGERVKYGVDYPDGKSNCRDCGVEFGQYHVYTCCVERCAFCKVGQAIGCSCWEAAEVPTQ